MRSLGFSNRFSILFMMALVLRLSLFSVCLLAFTACNTTPTSPEADSPPTATAVTEQTTEQVSDSLQQAATDSNVLESQGLASDLLNVLVPKKQPPPVVEVSIEGVTEQLLQNVQAYVDIYRNRTDERLSSVQIERLHAKAPEQIQRALQPFGYYRATVESELVAPTKEGEAWQATYTINLGEAITLKNVSLEVTGEGKQDSALMAKLADSPLQVGQILQHTEYEQFKREFYNLAIERGYLDTEWESSQILVNLKPPRYHADIKLHLATAKRYRFGSVTFVQDNFQESLLNTFIPFAENDVYANQSLVAFRQALMDSGYFANIDIQKQPQVAQQRVDLTVYLTPRKKNLYKVRAGYGTDRGIQIGLQAERRFLNSRGHRLGADVVLTEKDKHYIGRASYIIPLNVQDKSFLEFALQYEGEDIQAGTRTLGGDGETRLENATLHFNKRHQRRLFGLELQEAWEMSYLQESYDLLGLLGNTIDREILQQILSADEFKVLAPNYRALMPGLNWTYRQVDNAIFIRNGQQLRFGMKGAQEGIASNVSFWQAHVDANLIRPLFKRGRVIARQELAYTDVSTISILDTFTTHIMPRSFQFRTGGDRTVRGYDYEELAGTEDSLVSGKHLWVSSVEYEHPVIDKWSVATFFDVGNAFDSFSSMDLHKGTGIGVRWYSPVGLVRLDVAHALDDGDPWRVHFMVGPEF